MHFGYNCKHYLPSYMKCRRLIEERKKQKELLELKWFSIKEALIYSHLLKFDLYDSIEKKNIKVKKSGKHNISIGIIAAWQYDECPLAHGGGQCMYFDKHNSAKINCLAEMADINDKHPNMPIIPDENEIEIFTQKFCKYIEQKDSKKNDSQLF